MSEWRWLENPAYAGKPARKLTAECHDRSPFITIQCSCGFDNHVHESAIVEVPTDRGVGSRCHGCDDVMTFKPGELHEAFTEMRRRGWIT